VGEFRIETERLILRSWRDEDASPFHKMGSDPKVMEFLGPLRTLAQARESVAGQQALQSDHGYCFWATERRSDGNMIGFCGLEPGPTATPLEGKTEIGWRLAAAEWGKGYASEAARAALDWGFANLPDPDIWAITVAANTRSWGLMERLGMTRMPDLDFDHPSLPKDSPLLRHITYRISASCRWSDADRHPQV
jgi:RimJ/RimL family protein N-acetyltransferase